MADSETPPVAAPAADRPASPSSSDKSGSSGESSGKFYSLFQSIQKNIETLNFVTKEIEKINDRILFHSSTISPAEESSLIQKVSHLHKDTSMKTRDTNRLIKALRVETTRSVPSPGNELKQESEKSEEEKEEESRDVEDKDNICRTVTRSFTDELLLYQSCIQDFKSELKERLTKQVQRFRPTASEDFVDMSLRGDSSRSALFRDIMAIEEKEMSEEEAKNLKDQIAEKYVVIAELSAGGSELNKIFLNLAADSDGMSDSDNDDDKKPRSSSTRSSKKNPSSNPVDELLGNRNAKMDGSSASQTRPQGQRPNRMFAFMNRNRNANRSDTMSGGTVYKRRGNRSSRWMALFLLATVALAAMAGIVLLH